MRITSLPAARPGRGPHQTGRRKLESKSGSYEGMALLERKRKRDAEDVSGLGAKTTQKAENLTAWARCKMEKGCVCGHIPCDVVTKNLKRCLYCGNIGSRKCGKVGCKDKAKEMALAMAGLEADEDVDGDGDAGEAAADGLDLENPMVGVAGSWGGD